MSESLPSTTVRNEGAGGVQSHGASIEEAINPVSIYESATSPYRSSPSVIAEKLPALSSASKEDNNAVKVLDSEWNDQAISGEERPVAPSSSEGNPYGSGLGRPTSKGWKPPPLPTPSLDR